MNKEFLSRLLKIISVRINDIKSNSISELDDKIIIGITSTNILIDSFDETIEYLTGLTDQEIESLIYSLANFLVCLYNNEANNE